MRKMLHFLLLALLLWGCAPSPPPSSSPSVPTSTSTPTSSTTPGPEKGISVDEIIILQAEDDHQWQVIGLYTNRSAEALQDIQLEVGVYSADHSLQGIRLLAPEVHVLPPDGQMAFLTEFSSTAPIMYGEGRVIHAVTADGNPDGPASVDVSIQEAFSTSPGDFLAAGTLSNTFAQTLQIDDLIILVRNPEGEVTAAAESFIGMHTLLPDQETVFASPIQVLNSEDTFDIFPRAHEVTLDPVPPFSFLQEPAINFDTQGRPIITAYIYNESDSPHWADLVVTIYDGEMPIGVAQALLPAPIPPGESRSFTVRSWFPLQSAAALGEMEDHSLSVVAEFDPAGCVPSDHYPRPLNISLNYFEQIGNLLFVRGIVTNPWDLTLLEPSASLSLRSIEGTLLSSTWEVMTSSIGPQESIEFQLSIPLPTQVDPAMSEYDLQAFGLLP